MTRHDPVAHAELPVSRSANRWFGSVERMRIRYAFLTVLGLLVAGLAGCAPQAEPDWPAAEAAAQKFEDVASSQDGFLGAASFRSDREGSQSPDRSDVVLSYANDVLVEGATIACFGDGTARLGFTVRVGSSWLGGESAEIECDGAAHAIDLDEPFAEVNAVSINSARAEGAGGMFVVIVSGVGSPGKLAS